MLTCYARQLFHWLQQILKYSLSGELWVKKWPWPYQHYMLSLLRKTMANSLEQIWPPGFGNTWRLKVASSSDEMIALLAKFVCSAYCPKSIHMIFTQTCGGIFPPSILQRASGCLHLASSRSTSNVHIQCQVWIYHLILLTSNKATLCSMAITKQKIDSCYIPVTTKVHPAPMASLNWSMSM